MATKGIYIYGIVPNFCGTELFCSLKNSDVYFISYQDISAIVSDSDKAYIDFADRESLARLLVHHQKTIEEIMAAGFNMILPMKFGTAVQNREEVLSILSRGHDLITETLKKTEFLNEIDLVVTWADFGGTLKEIANHPDIAEVKNKLLKNIDSCTQADQVKVGMLIKEKLDGQNKQVELNILNSLSALSEDVKMHEAMNDQMVSNAAFLIHRNKKEEFEQVIDNLDKEYNGMLNFKLVGPLPCYSFYTIEVKELDAEHVSQAKTELGLSEASSEAEIKKAYQQKAKEFHPDINHGKGNEVNFNRIKKAYFTLLQYSDAVSHSSKEYLISSEKMSGNVILVQIKE